jgi:hypothetical protein
LYRRRARVAREKHCGKGRRDESPFVGDPGRRVLILQDFELQWSRGLHEILIGRIRLSGTAFSAPRFTLSVSSKAPDQNAMAHFNADLWTPI